MTHGGAVILGIGIPNRLDPDRPGSVPIVRSEGQRGGLDPYVTVGGGDVQGGFGRRSRIQMHLVGAFSTLVYGQVRL